MKKKTTKTMITRILACALLVATLGLSLASCAAGDKVKDAAGKVWDIAVDGAEKIYDKAKDSMAFEQTSGMAAIRLLSDTETDESAAVPTYAGTLTAQDFVGNWTNTQAKDALYVQSKERVGSIVSVTGATIGDYWSVEPGEKPIVAIDGNNSMISILLPAGYTDVATWAANAGNFSITVTPVMEKTLQAIVKPDSATDKSVTWSVSTTEEGVDVSEYIRLLTFDGAAENKVTVLALKPFAGHEFRIVCKTNVGGFTAECKVTYDGQPSYLGFHKVLADGGYQHVTGQQHLEIGTTDFELALDNIFYSVGSKYGQFEVVSTNYEGTVSYTQTSSAGSSHFSKYDILLMDNLLKGEVSCDKMDISNFIKAEIIDQKLHLTIYRTFAGYSFECAGNQFELDGGDVVFSVIVKDTVSGVTNTLRFNILDVSSVSLSDAALTF